MMVLGLRHSQKHRSSETVLPPNVLPAKNAKRDSHPIAVCVAPMKKALMEKFELTVRRKVELVMLKLQEHDWAFRAAFPGPVYPKRGSERAAYARYDREREYQAWVWSLITLDETKSWEYNGPRWVVCSDEGIERAVEVARQQAAAHFDSYVEKLISKVTGRGTLYEQHENVVVAATIEETGDVWSESILIVKVHASDRPEMTRYEHWKTQTVWNTSVYGLPFMQWPTRQIKGTK